MTAVRAWEPGPATNVAAQVRSVVERERQGPATQNWRPKPGRGPDAEFQAYDGGLWRYRAAPMTARATASRTRR